MGWVSQALQKVSDTVADPAKGLTNLGKDISSSPVAQAAITAGGAALGVPPAVTAGILGANQASQTGNLGQGLLTGGLSYLGGNSVNNLLTPSGGVGATTGAFDFSPSLGGVWQGLTGTGGLLSGLGSSLGQGAMSSIGSMLSGNAQGGMNTNTAAMLSSLLGTGLSYAGADKQAQAMKDAAQISANSQLETAKLAADAARFRPVGVTNAFGGSQFTTDASGNVTGATYTPNAQLASLISRLQDAGSGLMDQAGRTQQASQGLFNLGQKYVAQDPNAVAQQWLGQQQNLLKASDDMAYANIQQNLANSGRTGLSIAQGGSNLAANPEMAAYYNAKAQRDAQLAADAQKFGQQNVTFGQGLLGSSQQLSSGAYAPLQNALSAAGGIDTLGRSAFDTGVALGGRNVNTAGANALMQGGIGAAQALQSANEFSPVARLLGGLGTNQGFNNAVGSWFSNALGGSSQPYVQQPTVKQSIYGVY